MREGFKVFAHTSEVGLEITGADWAGFYRAAAEGLLCLYGLGLGAPSSGKTSRSFAAETPEELLVAWLSELIFLIGARRQIPAGIEVLEAGPRSLRVRLSLKPKARRVELAREIKAVTYHGLKVAKKPGGLKARLILDV